MSDFEILVDGVDFGEGPRWRDGSLWYSDFYQYAVYRVSETGLREVEVGGLTQQPSGLGWLPDGRLLIVSMLDRRVLRRELDGEIVEHADLSGVAEHHCNDMVVAANGDAYVGNFGFDLDGGGTDAFAPGTLALVRPDGTVSPAAGDMWFANGSVISADGATLIVGETFAGRYSAFTIGDDGSLHDRRIWAEVPGTAPDGCAVDAEGAIWFADAIGHQVVRVREGGEVTHRLATDAPTFACTLGGPGGDQLYVLTAPGAGAEHAAGRGEGAVLVTTIDVPAA
ncbi:MAG: SMP-30/gluconolactonase/LRE family protein [Acidimicrobiia bacterium]|nr:SMP-30/gluconolactonase/LRE family protein [Acidimicrobiia bacterium]